MRAGWTVVALGLGLGFAPVATAQQNVGSQEAAGFFTGVNPRNITFTPVDTSKVVKQYNSLVRQPSQPSAFNISRIFHPFSTSQAIRKPSQLSAFNVMNIFHPFTMPRWPPLIGSSTPPSPIQTMTVQSRNFLAPGQ
jgi:hypothetical protein